MEYSASVPWICLVIVYLGVHYSDDSIEKPVDLNKYKFLKNLNISAKNHSKSNPFDYQKFPFHLLKHATKKFKKPPKTFDERKRLLEKACSQYFLRTKRDKIKYNPSNGTDLVSTIAYQIPRKIIGFDIDNRLMYCFLPKAGTTNWSTLAGSIKNNKTLQEYLTSIGSHKDNIYHELEKAQFLMKQHVMNPIKLDFGERFQGVLLTRHPLTRLYSTWSHRLSNSEPAHEKMFKKQIGYIKNHYYNKTFNEHLPRGIFVPLAAFLRFASSPVGHNSRLFNIHWATIQEICHPCQLVENYNFIVMQETAKEDAENLLIKLGKDLQELPGVYQKDRSKTEVRHGNSKGDVAQSSDILQRIINIQEYYRKNVPRHVVMQIYKQYYWDFQLFGYTIDGYV